MKQVPLHEVKNDLSRLLRRAETEDIVITRHGPIINRIAPVAESAPPLALRWP